MVHYEYKSNHLLNDGQTKAAKSSIQISLLQLFTFYCEIGSRFIRFGYAIDA